jgi:hypothetical protein
MIASRLIESPALDLSPLGWISSAETGRTKANLMSNSGRDPAAGLAPSIRESTLFAYHRIRDRMKTGRQNAVQLTNLMPSGSVWN